MQRLIHTLWDTGLRLRCPVCEQGRLFRDWFTMHSVCPHCSVRFERYDGEVTGGMTLSILVTAVIFLVGYYLSELLWNIPLALDLAIWITFSIFFPILFYRYSRALWVAFLHLTGDVYWDKEPYQETHLTIVDAFLNHPPEPPPAPKPPPTPSNEDDQSNQEQTTPT